MQLEETNLNTQHQARLSYLDCLHGVVRVPLDSAGTRKISKRARGSSRGGIPYFSPLLQKYIVLKTESHLEGSSLFVAMSDPNVVHIWDQPTSINYEDADGKLAHYTADARLEYRCGRKVLVETNMSTEQNTLSSAQADDAMSEVFVEQTEFARAVGAERHWAFFGGMHQLVCVTGSDLAPIAQPEPLRRLCRFIGMR